LLLWKTFKTIRKEKRLRITACCEGNVISKGKLKGPPHPPPPLERKTFLGLLNKRYHKVSSCQ
jgi:hypothetical protein